MTLWEFLRGRMTLYGNKVALTDGKITYNELVSLVESGRENGRDCGKLRIIREKSRLKMAISILQCLACGDVAIPVDECYGETYIRNLEALTDGDGEAYENLAFVMFTSGTTGKPKGVMLSHAAVIENLKGISNYFKVCAGQRITIIRPLVHIAVLTGELLYGLYSGLAIDFYEEPFSPQRIAAYLKEKETQIIGCTPTLLYHLHSHLAENSLTDVVISGERIADGLIEELKEYQEKIRFYNVYGLTENAPRVTALVPEDFFRYPVSVGKPLIDTELQLRDGELFVRSKSVMQGYYKRPDLTAEKLRDGWLRTGDIAEIKEGYLYILGRKDGMIIRSGLNVFPEDIEREVMAIDGIEDCIVYGENDPAFGQKICLDYIGKISPSELRRWLSGRLTCAVMPNRIKKTEMIFSTPSGKKIRK